MIGSFLADWPVRYPGNLQPSITDMSPRQTASGREMSCTRPFRRRPAAASPGLDEAVSDPVMIMLGATHRRRLG